ncbi:MAG: aspartyl protease family protein [Bacteroidia bacterium]|nr:aspartyl protease family protein [Bacteroidia bacterium]NND12228.1 PDZ domain-containing protein [Flavobacteriaceae bacterium]RZV66058.1 MAG: PDZ domain-containing protein [Flavobacteriaceae bacterium]
MRSSFLVILALILNFQAYSQGSFILKNKAASHKIKFELINNLIVFPVEINGVELSFLLDTGVSKPIIFNSLEGIDTLEVHDTEKIFLRGLGEGKPIEALKSKRNLFKVGDALNVNQTLYIIFDTSMDFAPRLGIPVHGIIGYDLFKDFVVEINYTSKFIKLHDPKKYRSKSCRKCESMGLEFYNLKPYLEAVIEVNDENIPVKLLIDSGGSDALWLFEDENKKVSGPESYFEDFLGSGLSGSIYGKRSKIDQLKLGKFTFKDVNVAFPDSVSIRHAKKFVERNGSIAAELLKRFNLVFDYGRKTLLLKRNGYFKEPFHYNKSGISLEYGDVRLVKEEQTRNAGKYATPRTDVKGSTPIILVTTFKYSFKPAFTIVQLRKDSPALRAGLQLNDVILSVNNKPSHEFTLQEMIENFYGRDGTMVKLKIDRDGKEMVFEFRLEPILKKKSPSN